MKQHIVIIGGGPAGIASARALLAESDDFIVNIFETRPNFGGLWNYSPIEGPMYRDLDANVPRDLIGFTDFPFPGQGTETSYPSRQEVLEYIRSYSREVTRSPRITVHLNTKIGAVTKEGDSGKWVTTTTEGECFFSDFLILATGHYEFPHWPNIPGLRKHSGVIHSLDYNSPEEFTNKHILLIGNSRSGTDIAIQLLSATAPISISRRKEGPADHIFEKDPDSVVWKPEVSKVIGHAVYFTDGTCEVYDRVIVCTGYLYDFPFLKYELDSLELLDKERVRLHNFYRHTFFIGDPSLATLGMNKGMVPFPTFETQGEVIARVWNNKIQLPDVSTMLAEEANTLRNRVYPEKFHDLPMELDIDFMQTLWDWADEAPGKLRVDRWNKNKIEWRKTAGKVKEIEDTKNLLKSKAVREMHQNNGYHIHSQKDPNVVMV